MSIQNFRDVENVTCGFLEGRIIHKRREMAKEFYYMTIPYKYKNKIQGLTKKQVQEYIKLLREDAIEIRKKEKQKEDLTNKIIDINKKYADGDWNFSTIIMSIMLEMRLKEL